MKKINNILVTTYWAFDNALITNYTLPYIRIIQKQIHPNSKIFLLTLSPKIKNSAEKLRAVKKEYESQGVYLINFNYNPFGPVMFFRLIWMFVYLLAFVLNNKIKTIHSWCTPAGAIGFVVSVITRVPLILDSFEPHADTMVETNTWKKNSFAYKVLFYFEKLQLNRALEVICTTEGMIGYCDTTYGVKKERYFIKPACVDLELFYPTKKDYALINEIKPGNIVCVYAGKFGDIYLDAEVFEFFAVAHVHWGEKFKVLLLTNHSNAEIDDFCFKADLDKNVIIKRFVPHKDVSKYMNLGDFGICPVRPIPTKRFCTPIKNGEYWALGLPVIITKNISDDSDLIVTNNAGYVLKELNIHEYELAVKKIDALLIEPDLGVKIRQIAEIKRNFSIAEKIYKTIYV